MRLSSVKITRIYCARGGASTFNSFSTAFAVSQAVGHRGDVVHAVDIWIEHRVGAAFGNLLDTTVQIADDALQAKTFSPSSRRMTRSTPCVAGCCGPILMTNSFASRYGFSGVSRSSGENVFESVMNQSLMVALSSWPSVLGRRRNLLSALNSQVDLYPFAILLQDVVILAQGIALPTFGKQNSFQIRMPRRT